jgi:hypothetical protein
VEATFLKLCQDVQFNPLPVLIGLFDGMRSTRFPCPFPPLHVFAEVEVDGLDVGKKLTFAFDFVNPDGEAVYRAERDMVVPKPVNPVQPRLQIHIPLVAEAIRNQMWIKEPGAWRLDLMCDETKLASEPFYFDQHPAGL